MKIQSQLLVLALLLTGVPLGSLQAARPKAQPHVGMYQKSGREIANMSDAAFDDLNPDQVKQLVEMAITGTVSDKKSAAQKLINKKLGGSQKFINKNAASLEKALFAVKDTPKTVSRTPATSTSKVPVATESTTKSVNLPASSSTKDNTNKEPQEKNSPHFTLADVTNLSGNAVKYTKIINDMATIANNAGLDSSKWSEEDIKEFLKKTTEYITFPIDQNDQPYYMKLEAAKLYDDIQDKVIFDGIRKWQKNERQYSDVINLEDLFSLAD